MRNIKYATPIFALFFSNVVVATENMPPKNPYLADSTYSISHGTPAQQGSFAVAGPTGQSRQLENNEIDYADIGMLHMAGLTSSPYEDGRRVIWSNGIDRIAKVDYDSYAVISTLKAKGMPYHSVATGNELIRNLETTEGKEQLGIAFGAAKSLFSGMSGVYTLLDKNNHYYMAGRDGSITVYGDAEAGNPDSGIVVVRRGQIPVPLRGEMVGMNMSYDGWLFVASTGGDLVALSPDFSKHRIIALPHREGAEKFVDGPQEFNWIRNGFAVDKEGGIYIVSNDHMHKVVWTGTDFSTDPADGAWSEPYRNGLGIGSGSTPSLMGFGDEDQFVVITDGDALMNLTLFWRDDIPEDWQQLEGAPSPRIAGYLPADMGEMNLTEAQSEQSVAVAGYGALVVNNVPRNAPPGMKGRAAFILVGFLGNEEVYQPFGVQKFRWNPEKQRLEQAWVNTGISSPNGVPGISLGNNLVYLVGARSGKWTMEALDFQTGQSAFHYMLGGQRFNGFGSAVLIDEDGRLHYGSLWGRTRLSPNGQQ
jgi:hypothetical protein